MGYLRKQWESMASGDWFEQLGKGRWPNLDNPPPLRKMTEDELRMLEKWFYQDHGYYSRSNNEFEQWLRANW